MTFRQRNWNRTFGYSIIGLLAMLAVPLLGQAGSTSASRPMSPSIKITVVPPSGEGSERMERIAGTVSGADFKSCKVVIFARTNKWYVQPYTNNPKTSIGSDGKWETTTHLGYEYAALLVRSDYEPTDTAS
ncbi:MAG: hypothetical protein ACREDR_04900, partial [Blastocatellia bacterium]